MSQLGWDSQIVPLELNLVRISRWNKLVRLETAGPSLRATILPHNPNPFLNADSL